MVVDRFFSGFCGWYLKSRNPTISREPNPAHDKRIRIGDVGFIRRGKFHLMFHAGPSLTRTRRLGHDVPSTFKPLTIGDTIFCEPRPPDCLCTEVVEEYEAGLGATTSTTLYAPPLRLSFGYLKRLVPLRPLELGAHFSYKLTGNSGAALRTRYPTYVEDAELESAFETYTKCHYESWVTFAHQKRYGDVRPVLVSGFDMTKDFAMLAYSSKSTSLEGDSHIEVSMFASASASITVKRHRTCSPHFKCGPQPWGHAPSTRRTIGFPSLRLANPRAPPKEFNQCVFIRYYTARPRKWMPPKIIRAGAGPHDLGPGDNKGDSPPELTVETPAEPNMSGDEGLGGRSDLTTDAAASDPIVIVRNIPDVGCFPPPFVSVLTPFQDTEYDSWDLIAAYVFRVISFQTSH